MFDAQTRSCCTHVLFTRAAGYLNGSAVVHDSDSGHRIFKLHFLLRRVRGKGRTNLQTKPHPGETWCPSHFSTLMSSRNIGGGCVCVWGECGPMPSFCYNAWVLYWNACNVQAFFVALFPPFPTFPSSTSTFHWLSFPSRPYRPVLGSTSLGNNLLPSIHNANCGAQPEKATVAHTFIPYF